MRRLIFLFLLLLGWNFGYGQKFSFVTEFGLLSSQIDGDGLTGFTKKGIKAGIGVNYPLLESLILSVDGSYNQQGSKKSTSYKLKIGRIADTTESDINTIGLGLSFIYMPPTKSLFFGTGLVYHRLLSYDLDIVEYRSPGTPARVIDSQSVANSYIAFKVLAGYKLGPNFRFNISFERALSNIMNIPIDDINTLSPYSLTYSLSYELNPSKSNTRKRHRKKKRTRE